MAECEADYPVSSAEVKSVLRFTSATLCDFVHAALSTKRALPLLKKGCVISVSDSYLGGLDAETGLHGFTQLIQGSVGIIPQIRS